MEKKSLNNNLKKAKSEKNDEFYTELTDIEKELKLKIQSTHKTIRAHLSSPLEQENLGLKEYEPYIEVEQTAYLSSGIIFEYSFTRYHYNNFELQTVTVQ